ncbi:Hypothetical protein R9X50_00194800 [Acrodontium crateriforme]|uniref:Glycosyl hydrolase family 13 catalytic domain-containing protein n=1 Tax=Acrodontium crateriforme TaxID=150365 RepID=A0AAQ3M2Z8_9PEZI|nr:Hypothetical protein R9X50_00194800 [Acrodontium crateriforme]
MVATTSHSSPAWWKESVVYQIYPASFNSTGSGSEPGWGDVKGITAKLDYLKALGADVVWSSPIYKSPQVDMGYDISDYENIDPKFGSLEDVDELIRELKKRDMKLMMDFVANHTSDQHQWFIDSRSSRENSRRDWYIWQPAKYDADGTRQPPNNWSMMLGEAHSAWTWDEKTQEYYLSLFTSEQPDLNWRNTEVRKAIHNVLRFWLDRGVSGFRMDVINLISKVEGYPDAQIVDPNVKYQPGFKHFANGPHMNDYLREMNDEVLSKYDTITVGEMPFVRDHDEIMKVVGTDRKELNMIFIFDIVDIDNGTFRMDLREWKPKDIKNIVSRYQKLMEERDGWNSIFVENHDNPRSISRYCDDSEKFRELSAKMLCLMQTTLSGTLYVYQGEEIGMRNLRSEIGPEEYKDIETVNYWQKMNDLYPGDTDKLAYARKVIQTKARDHARTPVQWTDGPNSGFCAPDTKPWMMVNTDYQTVNAAAQEKARKDGDLSPLQFWTRALANRKENKDVLVYGKYELLDSSDKSSIFAYKRMSDSRAFITVLNFSHEHVEWTLPESIKLEKWVAGNYPGDGANVATVGKITLKPWEGVLGMVKS